MTPGIFTEFGRTTLACETMQEIMEEVKKPLSAVSTPIEIQHDMVQTSRFHIEHGPTDNITPKVLKIIKLKETIAPAIETY